MDIMGHIWAGTWRLPVLDHSWCCPSQGHISSAQTHCFASLPLTRRGALTDLLGQITLSEQIMCDHAPLWEMYTSGFVNTKTSNQLPRLQLGKAYTVSFCRSRGFNQSKQQIITLSHQHKSSVYLRSAATYILLYWLSQETLPPHWFIWIIETQQHKLRESIKVHHTTSTNSKLKGYFRQKWTCCAYFPHFTLF